MHLHQHAPVRGAACHGRARRARPLAATGHDSAASDAPSTSAQARQLYQLSATEATTSPAANSSVASIVAAQSPAVLGAAAVGVGITAWGLAQAFNRGSRAYANNVGQEYDAWTEEGLLE